MDFHFKANVYIQVYIHVYSYVEYSVLFNREIIFYESSNIKIRVYHTKNKSVVTLSIFICMVFHLQTRSVYQSAAKSSHFQNQNFVG